ncbi:MAG: AbrB/MazE/SpoVT family DNA-binding domain-containing protein [Gemmatimonadota bacterium]|nr:AbrB/MazE/SpoVT family DNA-binding domain-containing protein [Gemmatimonadota bacterium]MDE2870962.1 AbrB/MazE/SpoVT family DNA-binding domain-containing protein [Gemmatimonadota bacterium]
MEFAKITARGQTTIPKRIREAAGLREGDLVAFDLRGGHLVLRKVEVEPDRYLEGVSGLMEEWTSPEDEEAWRDL